VHVEILIICYDNHDVWPFILCQWHLIQGIDASSKGSDEAENVLHDDLQSEFN
jgi:hypothetical protein